MKRTYSSTEKTNDKYIHNLFYKLVYQNDYKTSIVCNSFIFYLYNFTFLNYQVKQLDDLPFYDYQILSVFLPEPYWISL